MSVKLQRQTVVYNPTACMALTISARVLMRSNQNALAVAGNAAYLGVLVAMLCGGIFIAVMHVANRKKTAGLFAEGTASRIARVLLGAAMLFLSLEALRGVLDAVQTFELTATPRVFVGLALLGALGSLVYRGLWPLCRSTAIVGVPLMLLYLLVVASSLDSYHGTDQMFPLLGYGWQSVVHVGLRQGAMLIVLMYPFAEQKHVEQPAKAALRAMLIGCGAVLVGLLCYSLIWPYDKAALDGWPIQRLATVADHTKAFQRVKPLFTIVWIITLATSYLFYWRGGLRLVSDALQIHDDTPLVWPTALAALSLAVPQAQKLPDWVSSALDSRNMVWLGVAVLILAIALCNRGRDTKSAA